MKNVSEAEVTKFTDDSVHWWDKKGPMRVLHEINPTRVAYLKQFVDIKGKSLLDIGCGGGIYTEGLAKEQAKVTGIDANESAIQAAIAHAKQASLNIDYHHTLIEDFSDTCRPVDVVTCMELLEHVPDPAELLQHALKCLKPGGILCLSTINRNVKSYLLAIVAAEYVLGLIPVKTHDYDKLIRPSELERILSKLNCELVDLTGMGYNPISGKAWLQRDVSVNYFMTFRKNGGA